MLVPKSALRTDDCFGLDFSFLDDEPPSRAKYSGSFANETGRRNSRDQYSAGRPGSIASAKSDKLDDRVGRPSFARAHQAHWPTFEKLVS